MYFLVVLFCAYIDDVFAWLRGLAEHISVGDGFKFCQYCLLQYNHNIVITYLWIAYASLILVKTTNIIIVMLYLCQGS